MGFFCNIRKFHTTWSHKEIIFSLDLRLIIDWFFFPIACTKVVTNEQNSCNLTSLEVSPRPHMFYSHKKQTYFPKINTSKRLLHVIFYFIKAFGAVLPRILSDIRVSITLSPVRLMLFVHALTQLFKLQLKGESIET